MNIEVIGRNRTDLSKRLYVLSLHQIEDKKIEISILNRENRNILSSCTVDLNTFIPSKAYTITIGCYGTDFEGNDYTFSEPIFYEDNLNSKLNTTIKEIKFNKRLVVRNPFERILDIPYVVLRYFTDTDLLMVEVCAVDFDISNNEIENITFYDTNDEELFNGVIKEKIAQMRIDQLENYLKKVDFMNKISTPNMIIYQQIQIDFLFKLLMKIITEDPEKLNAYGNEIQNFWVTKLQMENNSLLDGREALTYDFLNKNSKYADLMKNLLDNLKDIR